MQWWVSVLQRFQRINNKATGQRLHLLHWTGQFDMFDIESDIVWYILTENSVRGFRRIPAWSIESVAPGQAWGITGAPNQHSTVLLVSLPMHSRSKGTWNFQTFQSLFQYFECCFIQFISAYRFCWFLSWARLWKDWTTSTSCTSFTSSHLGQRKPPRHPPHKTFRARATYRNVATALSDLSVLA